jgi:RecA-family ATPase
MDYVPFTEAAKTAAPARHYTGVSAADLATRHFPELRYIVPSLLPEGLTILAGGIKLGKSWMTMDWGYAVAFGGHAMGSIPCKHGDVLHLALEDNQRRLQRRQQILMGDGPYPDRLEFNCTWPRLEDGGIEEIEAWAESVSNPRLVVTDTLKMVRRSQRNGEALYDYDYSTAEPLRDLAGRYGIAIVVVHHLNKRRDSDDPFDQVSGSNGLSACADATLILDRTNQGTTLYGRGRDIEEFEKAIQFDQTTGRWSILGDANEVHRSEERATILSVLLIADAPLGPGEIASATGMPRNNVDQLLFKMAKDQQVQKTGRGQYVHADRDDLT